MKTPPTSWTIDYARPDSDETGLCIRQGDVFFAFEGAQADIIIAALRAAEQRGIERAYAVCEAEHLESNGQEGRHETDDSYDQAVEDCLVAIRALAQGGE